MLPALLISHRVCLIQLTLARAFTLSPPCHSAMVEALTTLTVSQRVPSRMQLCRPRALICSFTSASWPLAFLSFLPHFPTFPSIWTHVSEGFGGIQTKTVWTMDDMHPHLGCELWGSICLRVSLTVSFGLQLALTCHCCVNCLCALLLRVTMRVGLCGTNWSFNPYTAHMENDQRGPLTANEAERAFSLSLLFSFFPNSFFISKM